MLLFILYYIILYIYIHTFIHTYIHTYTHTSTESRVLPYDTHYFYTYIIYINSVTSPILKIYHFNIYFTYIK